MYTVKQARLLAGLSQAKVAQKMGVNVDTYRRIEKNPECSTIESAKKICRILNMPFDTIFFDRCSTFGREDNAS